MNDLSKTYDSKTFKHEVLIAFWLAVFKERLAIT